MKRLFIVLAMLVAINANAQWVLKYSGGESIGLYAIQFVNENTGFIVGAEESYSVTGSVFLKTTDGGNTWVRINMNLILNHYLYALSFINVNTGFACGRNSYVRKTTDGGQTWASYLAATNTPNLNAIQFLNEQTGYVGGRYGYRAKTTNGGVNWTQLDTALSHIEIIHFFDVNTGIMGDANSGIYRTTNGGLNWSYKYQTDTNGLAYDLYNASFINENTGYIIGTTYYSSCLFKTTNKGIDWYVVKTLPYASHSVFGLNSSTIFIGGLYPYILCTTNAGLTWSNQNLPASSTSADALFFINANTGFSCGSYGAICKTINGGVRVENISSNIPVNYSLSQNYPNPFNPMTNVKFSIVNAGEVKIVVYDIQGREVQTLVNEGLKPGTYEVKFDGSMLNSGVYFYKLVTEGYSETKRMLLIK